LLASTESELHNLSGTGRTSSRSDADADPSAPSVSHAVFDALHARVIDNQGVLAFRPSFGVVHVIAIVLAVRSPGQGLLHSFESHEPLMVR
jgi:hypothetical protein